MKKLLAITAAVAIMAMAGTAMAAGTANLTVQATVIGACTVTAGTMNFGQLDPVAAPLVNASFNATITCGPGTTYTVTPGAGARNLTGPGGNIPYAFNHAGSGTATGGADAYALTGQIAAGAYTGLAAGVYSETIVLNVNP